jgi:predicted lipid-binding transport protein (Tim44 family)
MQDDSILVTLIFLGLAVFVIIKLRSVLGQRTGFERPPEVVRKEREAMRAPAGDNVVPMPGVQAPRPAPPEPVDPAERWKGITEPGTPLAQGLEAITAADPSFDPREFTMGARAAYEMIVLAFAKGDRRTLKDLLSKEVYEGFAGAISDRETRGEVMESTFVSIDKADLAEARMVGKSAQVTVNFLSKLITVTRDKAGTVVDGNAEKIVDVNDVWTFARDTSSRDPNWKLVATESGQ